MRIPPVVVEKKTDAYMSVPYCFRPSQVPYKQYRNIRYMPSTTMYQLTFAEF